MKKVEVKSVEVVCRVKWLLVIPNGDLWKVKCGNENWKWMRNGRYSAACGKRKPINLTVE